MKAAVLHGPRDLRIEEVPAPEAGPHDLLVRIHSCAICGTDTQIYFGAHQAGHYPMILGHEASADIVEVGRDLSGYRVGERITFWVHFGSFAEYNCFDPATVAVGELPDHVTWDEGANTQLLCACLRGVDCSGLREGHTALVLGQGPVGLLTLQGARVYGAGATVGVDLLDSRLAMSKRVGATATVNASEPGWADRVLEAAGEVDVAFDCMNDDLSPDQDAIEQLLRAMRPGGRIVVLSLGSRRRGPSPHRLVGRNVTIKPSYVPFERARELIDLACDLVGRGEVDVNSFITQRIALDEVAHGMELTRKQPESVIKVMVQVAP